MQTEPIEAIPAGRRPVRQPGRGWAAAGVLAGVAGFAAMEVGTRLAPADPTAYADAELLVDAYASLGPGLVAAVLALYVIAAFAVVVFGAGLRRALAAQCPAGSLAPDVAWAGTLLVAGLCLVGSGPATEVFFGLLHAAESDPDITASLVRMMDTLPWVWGGLALTVTAVAFGALRHGAAPRWLGVVSIVFTVLVGGLAMAPLQYLAGYVGSIWLVVAGVAYLAGRGARTATMGA
ncbi:hypothetical protein K1T35_04890 [Pseudonocardia sp. DSM 110487]|uniref:hypothetical protein n=1 Tax=Pseudonocardia sp. DSM 110487 TaxID=2865833 RepID=UPI001C6A7358|nr:hypothetical protein [Pseudonocardia sp. DSM 110487]QYN36645.1 hypothetical protein K1T35_04890 [Pseudonocardia sp. DSM 110487]